MLNRERLDVVVVGGGQAGVSLAHYLQRRRLSHVVLERDVAFSSWRHRWEGFTANTPNWMNELPMCEFGPAHGASRDDFASRAELVDYFESCVAALESAILTKMNVTSVRECDGYWEVVANGEVFEARAVAICVGAMSTPRLPAAAADVPIEVEQLHSSEYHSPEQITSAKVLVVGSASSGVQICRLLAESNRFREVHLATSAVPVLPARVAGIPIHRLIHRFGLFDATRESMVGRFMYAGLEQRGDPITRPNTPRYLARHHGVSLHPKVVSVHRESVRFDDGSSLPSADMTILWCTGFRADYSFIEPTERAASFDESGYPIHRRGVVGGAPGLYFVGLRYQHTSSSHDIYGVGADAAYVAQEIGRQVGSRTPMRLTEVPHCCVCNGADARVVGAGWDFEYKSGCETYRATECSTCGNVYLNPRPSVAEFERIYPIEYHSLEFTAEQFSLVYLVRARLEARRLLKYCAGVPADARILDVGCGDGFHLNLLKRYGGKRWRLEGLDIDRRALGPAAVESGITFHEGVVEELELDADSYDVVYTIQTLEHVAHPDLMLAAVRRILKPGGRLVVVTDNTRSLDFGIFKRRHWGGYHFPRHWNLFNPWALSRLAENAGFKVDRIDTIVSPVNWVYSIHNFLVDKSAPEWMVKGFTLKSPVALAVFTVVDMVLQRSGRGALLNGYFVKPDTRDAPAVAPGDDWEQSAPQAAR